MFQYLGDANTAFDAALREDGALLAYYQSLPQATQKTVRAAGLYNAQEIGAYIDMLLAGEG